ncbi:oligosaccharide flippase family protein [Acinetobacter towneri]|uniref:oligosaccharide flippase family protein n=1 Tax=Acinetobacter towneri TaxID=202956 RepID=UPI001F61405C|nr:oligosaccharide flippase family protein [Acinetobacter towneri]UNT61962.1 oligosaccharide flippase family protein [Acinetobacter towneri]
MFAQIISFAIMPFITRLHTADSLGKYQFFATSALVLVPFISGSFTYAIKNSQSNYRALINLKLAMQFSFLSLILLFCCLPFLIFLLRGRLEWFIPYLPLLFIFVYLSANFQFAMALLTNNRSYNTQSSYTLSKSIISNLLKLFLSFYSKSGFSLILALIITELFQILRITRNNYREIFRFLIKFKWIRFKEELSNNKVYPIYVTMTSVLGVLMNWFPILITGILYGPKYAGLLGLAFMVVNTPVYPFITALQNVCFGELAKSRTRNIMLKVYLKSMIFSMVISIFGIFILGIYGEKLFIIIFGKDWAKAGEYAFICFIPIAFSFILSPIYNTLNHFYSFQKIFFWINLLFLMIGFSTTFYIGYKSYNFDLFLFAFALTMIASHLVLFFVSIFLYLFKDRVDI